VLDTSSFTSLKISLKSSSAGATLMDENHAWFTFLTREIDTGAQIVAVLTSTLDPDETLRVR
jgi:ACS family allantoate permease-like MFS transporter